MRGRGVSIVAATVIAVIAAPASQAFADGTIGGTVTRVTGGSTVPNICVSADSASANESVEVQTNGGGVYSIPNLGAATDYTVRFANCSSGTQHNLIAEYYDDEPDVDSADPVTVVDGQTTANVNAALAEGGRITGNVAGPGATPLADVCVRAHGANDAGSATTDGAGDYEIVGLPTGNYEVEFEPCVEGAVLGEWYDDQPTRQQADPVPVTAGQETPGIDADLALGGTISGTVTGPGSVALQDICVTAADPGFDNARTDETAADGSYQIVGLPAATYKVKFFSCGVGNFATEFHDDQPTRAAADALAVTAGSSTTGIDAELAEGATITGTVSGPGGPLDDVCVTSSDDELDGEVAETNASGQYALDGLRAGTYRVGFETCSASDLVAEFYDNKPSRALADPVTVTEGGITTGINAVLALEGKISGTVTGPGGAPLEDVCVEATDAAVETGDATTTNASGQYTLDGLRADGYKVEYTACGAGNFAPEFYNDKGSRATANTVSVSAGGTTSNINAELAVGARITGQVTGPGGIGLDGICVSASDAGSSSGSAVTNGAGTYTIEDLRSGTYKVEFSGCGNSNFVGEFWDDKPTRAAASAVSLASGETRANVNAELAAGGTIAGTVTGPGGAPLEGICVIASDANLEEESTQTASNGQYTLVGLSGGNHKVEFQACGDENFAGEFYDDKPTRAAADAVAVVPGTTISGIDAELVTGGRIVGSVTAPGGAPLQGICVEAFDADLVRTDTVVTDADGAYTLPDLRTGTYKVLFTSCGAGNLGYEWYTAKVTLAAADTVAVTAGSTTPGVDAELEPGGRISGTVTDGAEPVGGACVFAFDPDTDRIVYSSTQTAGDGTYSLDGLATGSFKLFYAGDCASPDLGAEYYDDSETFADATLVAVTAPGTTGSIDAILPLVVPPPSVTVDSGPNGPTSDRRPTFGFTASAGATVECSIGGGAPSYGPCSDAAAHQPAADLDDGSYSFSVRVTNSAGSDTDSRSFSVQNPTEDPPPGDPPPDADPPDIPPEVAACDEAKQKLIKAQLRLSDAKESGKKKKIKKAKKKVKKAKAAVQDAC